MIYKETEQIVNEINTSIEDSMLIEAIIQSNYFQGFGLSNSIINVYNSTTKDGIQEELKEIWNFINVRIEEETRNLQEILNEVNQKFSRFPFICRKNTLDNDYQISDSIISKTKTLISKGELRKSIEYLLEEINENKSSKIEKELLGLKSRINILEANWNKGVINQSEYSVETAKMVNYLLDFISLGTDNNPKLETDLSISDLILKHNGGQIQLDFRFFNNGDKGVMINRLRFSVIDISFEHYNVWIEASQKYGLDISSLNKVYDNIELTLSHFIPSSNVDRFQIDLIAKDIGRGEIRKILLKSELQTNLGWLAIPSLFLTIDGGK